MKRYWKGSDLQIEINITDKKGNTIPFAILDELTVYLKTTGEEYVKVSKGRGIESDVDGNIYIRLNEHSLDNLPDGLLRYDARWKISVEGWDNGYDTVQSCETDIFVKTPDNYVPKANVQEKSVTYTANGDYVLEPDGSYEGMSRADIKVELPLESKAVTYTANGDYVLEPDGGYEGMSRADIKVELPLESKAVTYTANGDYVLEPDGSYEGISRADIKVELPLESKSVTYTANGDYTLEPSEGYEGLQDVAIHIEIDTSEAENDGMMKFLRKQMTGKVELPIEAMNTPYCLYGQTGLTEVVVPEGATSIPDNFFRGCTYLEKITYPDTVTSFGADIYGNIDYEKIMSFPLPPYLNSSRNGNIYYRDGEIFNVPKYINILGDYGSPSYIGSYNDGIAKRLNFKGNLYQFYFTSFRAEEVDFRYNVQVPTFDYGSIYTGITKVIVPESLYDTWITTSPWSDYSSITESVPDTDYFIPYQTKSGNDIARNIGVMDNRYAVISSSDKKIHLRGTPWHLEGIVNSPDITYVDFAAANMEVPSFSYLFNEATSLTGYTLPPNKPLLCHGMFYNCSSLTTISEIDTSLVTDMMAMFRGCTSLISVPEMDTSQVTTMRSMFLFCDSLTSVSEMNTSLVTDMVDMFLGCKSLTNVGGFIGLKCNLDLSYSSLITHDSLMNVINKAADVTSSPKTLTLGSTNLSKLTDEEKGIATAKGWTLA